MRRLEGTPLVVVAIEVILAGAALAGLVTGRWSLVFVAVATFFLALVPQLFVRWIGVRFPPSFLAAIAFFVFATVFLGEAFDFYERYWWWDIVLHFGSALSFGVLGFLFIFMLFEGDRYAAPPAAVAVLAFAVAVSIGAVWEVFEYGMDELFGFNMQKTGLDDTMHDIIVDILGAAIGGFMGFVYLKGRAYGGIAAAMREFIRLNRRYFSKFDNR